MPDNKLVIRRLPPSMSEDDFLKQVSPLPSHDYFCFFEANSGLGLHSYSRAYINFLNQEDMSIFRERFDNYIFLDKDGHEYPAVVEQSFWHRSPKNGPFYKKQTLEASSSIEYCDRSSQANAIEVFHHLEKDKEFVEFIEKLRTPKKGLQQSPIRTLESNLDELTNSSSNSLTSGGKEKQVKVITPLVGYVNQKRIVKSSKRAK